MGSFSAEDAVLVAATEALPAHWHDLSDLLDRLARQGTNLSQCLEGSLPDDRLARYMAGALTADQVRRWQERLDELSGDCPGAWLTSVADAHYPRNLRAVYDRPPFLFVRGTLTDRDRLALAIVGSRDASPDAIEAATLLGKSAAAADVTVISGLARGVDAAAHRGALAGGGRTIAVLGTGIDQVYPPEHKELAEEIESQGAIVSQFKPGSPGTKSSFPMRNVVISGLSLASVVMDAGERSGTRSEAEAALRHDRPVLLWQPTLGDRPWARTWVECDRVEWTDSNEAVLAMVRVAHRR